MFMDLNNLSKLSDSQLVELYRNPATANEIKKAIITEINLRELNLSQIQEDNKAEGLIDNQKLIILFFSPLLIFVILLFIIFHHSLLKNWNRKKYKQFWEFTTLGFGIYTIILYILITFR